jgi:hypothetical protein
MNQPSSEHRTPLPPVTHRSWDRADMIGLVLPLRGRRLIVVNEQGSHHDYRAWSELRRSALEMVVDVVTEVEWWRYRHLAMRPEPVRWPASAVWVEVE